MKTGRAAKTALLLAGLLPLGLARPQPGAWPAASYLRVTHLSPNAAEVGVALRPTGGGPPLVPKPLRGLGYRDITGYLAVPTGEYAVSVETQAGELQETFTLAAGRSYTVAVVGLVVPDVLSQVQGDEGGFFGFLGDLFSRAANRTALSLQLVTYEDDAVSELGEASTTAEQPAAVGDVATGAGAGVCRLVYLRLVHAAPGTETATLALAAPPTGGKARNLANDLAFAGVGGLNAVTPDEAARLEVRLQGSGKGALTLGLNGAPLEPGKLHTLFLVGTPTAEAPLEVLTVRSARPALGRPSAASLRGDQTGALLGRGPQPAGRERAGQPGPAPLVGLAGR